jgi:hypothetical protein
MALSILETIRGNVQSKTQREALDAVMFWIEGSNFTDDMILTREEREARIKEILTHLRDCMTAEERRQEAAFYLEGIENIEAYGGTND